MAEYKGFGVETQEKQELGEQYQEMESLFEEFNPETEGGLVVMTNGRVAEIRHPLWKSDGDTSVATRITETPYVLGEMGEVQYSPEEEYAYDPDTVSVGTEFEYGVHYDNEPHQVTIDGSNFFAPDGGEIAAEDYDPEAFKQMIEGKTELAFGFEDYRRKRIQAAKESVELFEQHNMYPDYLSVFPEELADEDVLEHHYVQLMDRVMRDLKEFGCMSEQLNIGHENPEAARHALTKYQTYASIMALVTSASPIRDGSFETTLHDHYFENETLANDGEPLVFEDDYLRHKAKDEIEDEDGAKRKVTPYDWREFSRIYGSQSAGAYEKSLPISNEDFLREGDQALRNGNIISTERIGSWHGDRARFDRMEVCSLSGAGGNLRITLAAHELVIGFLKNQQEEYDTLKHVDPQQLEEGRERAVEIGQVNNFFMALSGKETDYLSPNGEVVSAEVMLRSMIKECGDEISEASANELLATLQPAPSASEFESAAEVFEGFLSPNSNMTASEALRIAHEVEPDLPVPEVLNQYSAAVRQQVKDM